MGSVYDGAQYTANMPGNANFGAMYSTTASTVTSPTKSTVGATFDVTGTVEDNDALGVFSITLNGHPVTLTTVYEEKLLGTGGTLLKNRKFFRNEPCMLVHADNLSIFDVRDFVRRYQEREKGVEITMMTFDAAEPETCGIVELDRRGIVKAFHEKVRNPPGNLANAAVYVLSPSVVDFLAGLGKEVIDFSTEVLPHFMGRINTFHNAIYHRDIGTLASLQAAQREYPAAVAKHSPGDAGRVSA